MCVCIDAMYFHTHSTDTYTYYDTIYITFLPYN